MEKLFTEIEWLRTVHKITIGELCKKAGITQRAYHYAKAGKGMSLVSMTKLAGALGYELKLERRWYD